MNNLDSKQLKKILAGLLGVALALCIFQAGIFVGYHKASFSYRMGDNFHEAYGNDHGRPGMGIPPRDFVGGNEALGKVISVNLPTITIADLSGTEKIITVDQTTSVRRMRDTVTAATIAVGDRTVIFGTTGTDGTIKATLVRIIPEIPPAMLPPVNPSVTQ
jgi:hypothetical protein